MKTKWIIVATGYGKKPSARQLWDQKRLPGLQTLAVARFDSVERDVIAPLAPVPKRKP